MSTEPLTIAHVLQSFEIGGGEQVALRLADLQKRQGHRVIAMSITAPPEGPLGAQFRHAGIETHTLPKRPGFDVLMPPRLLKQFIKQHVDVVHTHNPMTLIYASAAGKAARAVVVHTKHGEAADIGRRMLLRRGAARFVDAFVNVSKETQRYSEEQKEAPVAKQCVITNGVDCYRFRPDPNQRVAMRKELDLPADAFVVGNVARLMPVKWHALMLEALLPILEHHVRLVIVGDGEEREALQKQADAHENGMYVSLTGARNDIAKCMDAFDVFVMSSRTEGLPLVILEAMASGLPVVSSAVGGIPAVVVDGETGLLYDAGDAARLRELISQLRNDRDLGFRMGERGRQVVQERFSIERMADEYMQLYRKMGA